MSKLVVCTNLTLDGVMQGPGRPEEDTRDGFSHGGWAVPYAAMAHAGDVFANSGALLVGRRTYEDFYEAWGKHDTPYTAWFKNVPKYVVSRTLREPLPWENSTLLDGDLAQTVSAIKAALDKHILVMGSGVLVQSLMSQNLIDEWVLLIHPLVLGSGRRLFAHESSYTALSLVNSTTTSTGVLIATYASP